MKILILTNEIPYPLDSGGNVAQFYFTDHLRDDIDFIFLFNIKNEIDQRNSDKLKLIWKNVKIIDIVTYKLKANNQSLLSNLLTKGWGFIRDFKNYLIKSKQVVEKQNVFDYALWYLRPLNQEYIQAVENIIKSENPDIIQIEQIPFMTLGCLKTEIPKIYIHHELQTEVLKSASDNISSLNKEANSNYLISLTEVIEHSLLKKFDYTIVFSELDKLKLSRLGVKNVYDIPFSLKFSDEDITYSSREVNRLTFIGGDIHYPNVDAIEWYFEFGDFIYKETGLKLHVIGYWSTKNIQRFTCNYIIFEGFKDDLREALENSINIVPLRMGSGIRTKILQAFGMKIPVISTKIGIEGIKAQSSREYIIFQDKESFLLSLRYILDSDTEREIMVNNAYNFVKSNYDIKLLSERRMQLYKQILA